MECTNIPLLVLMFHVRAMHIVLINQTVKYKEYCVEVKMLHTQKKSTTLDRLHCKIPKLSECEIISQKKSVIVHMGRVAVVLHVTRLKTLGGPRRSWKDNIKIDLQQVGWGGLYCIDLADGRERWRELGNAVMNFRIPLNAGNFLTS
jgi:hypothetical protein